MGYAVLLALRLLANCPLRQLVNASALKESRATTIQGDNIGVLTNMTVVSTLPSELLMV
jgi:hypothetical protein